MLSSFVSILIPIRNEVTYIDRCIDADRPQDYLREKYEILVADGLSDDGTRHKLKPDSANDVREKIFNNPCKIVASRLKLLTRQARGEILIRLFCDCVIAPGYISKWLGYLHTKNVDDVGGPIQSFGENDASQVIALAMSPKFGSGLLLSLIKFWKSWSENPDIDFAIQTPSSS